MHPAKTSVNKRKWIQGNTVYARVCTSLNFLVCTLGFYVWTDSADATFCLKGTWAYTGLTLAQVSFNYSNYVLQ